MSEPHPFPAPHLHITPRFYWLLLLALIGINTCATYAGRSLGWRNIALETGLIELSELVLLMLSALVFAVSAYATRGAARMVFIGVFVLTCVMAQREIDSRWLFAHPLLYVLLKHHTIQGILYGLIFCTLLLYILRNREAFWHALTYLKTRHILPYILAAALVLLANLVEVISKYAEAGGDTEIRGFYLFLEELLELDAYFILLNIGLWSWFVGWRAKRNHGTSDMIRA